MDAGGKRRQIIFCLQTNTVRLKEYVSRLHPIAVRLREIAVRSQANGKFPQELPVCWQEPGILLQEIVVRVQEFGKFPQERGCSRNALGLGIKENPLIYRELDAGGQKEPLLRVGRVTPCAPVLADGHHRTSGGQGTARPDPSIHQHQHRLPVWSPAFRRLGPAKAGTPNFNKRGRGRRRLGRI